MTTIVVVVVVEKQQTNGWYASQTSEIFDSFYFSRHQKLLSLFRNKLRNTLNRQQQWAQTAIKQCNELKRPFFFFFSRLDEYLSDWLENSVRYW